VLAGPPLGVQAPRVVQPPGGRHYRIRRESTEEVPGHLPDRLRRRLHWSGEGDRAGPAALDGPRRADLPGGPTAPTPMSSSSPRPSPAPR
jgi:hypothetical protein